MNSSKREFRDKLDLLRDALLDTNISDIEDKVEKTFDEDIYEIIDEIESTVNGSLGQLEGISDNMCMEDVMGILDDVITMLSELSQQVY